VTRKSRISLALIASVTAFAGRSAFAGDQSASPQLSLSPTYAVDETPSRAPLMSALNSAGLAEPLESARIDVYGWIEGSYNYNFMNPAKEKNAGHAFDFEANHATINQLALNVQRDVDLTSHQFDFGGRIELLYGSDAVWTHSNNLFGGYNSARGVPDVLGGPDFQFDTPDLYIDIAVPLGNGIRVRLGRFEFWKPLDPNSSVFFSHSFAYVNALPFTNTGVTAAYAFTNELSVDAGISRGDNQSTSDDNGAIDFIGKMTWRPSDKIALTLYGSVGPEEPKNNSDYLFRINPTLSVTVSDQLTLFADAIFADEAGSRTAGIRDNFYGSSANAALKLDDHFSVAGRIEFFRDETGALVDAAGNTTLYEATVGLGVTPFPADRVGSNLKFRPELRYDYASRDYFNDFKRHDELIAAVDAIFNF